MHPTAADVLISPQNTGLPRYYAAAAKLPEVAVLAPVVGVFTLATGNGNAAVQLEAGTDSHFGKDIERPKLTEGRMFDPAKPDEAVADIALARELHLHAGSRLHLLTAPTGPAGFDFAHSVALDFRVVGVGVTRDKVVSVERPSLSTDADRRAGSTSWAESGPVQLRRRAGPIAAGSLDDRVREPSRSHAAPLSRDGRPALRRRRARAGRQGRAGHPSRGGGAGPLRTARGVDQSPRHRPDRRPTAVHRRHRTSRPSGAGHDQGPAGHAGHDRSRPRPPWSEPCWPSWWRWRRPP